MGTVNRGQVPFIRLCGCVGLRTLPPELSGRFSDCPEICHTDLLAGIRVRTASMQKRTYIEPVFCKLTYN